MAKVFELTAEQQQEADEWLKSRPPVIQELYAKCPADRLYLLKTSGHRVTIFSYSEGGTLTVTVSGDFNQVMFERNVFGIKPEDLEECDLPGPGEEVGVALKTQEEVDAYLDIVRAAEGISNVSPETSNAG